MELLYSLLGAAVNSGAIIIGGIVGLILGKRLPKRVCDTLTGGMYFCIVAVGILGLFDGESLLITILSIAIGALVGELIDIDRHILRFASFIQKKLASKKRGAASESEERELVVNGVVINPETRFSQSFVMCTLITVIGAMAITGSFSSALGDHTVLYSKSIIDAVTICVLSATLGVGCLMCAVPLFIYQGALTTVFFYAGALLPQRTIGEISCVGSVLIMIIGFNMLGLTKVKVANLIPAMFMPLLLCLFM